MQIHSGTKGHKYLACKCAGTSPPPNLTAAPCGFSALKFIFQISQSSNKAAAFPGALWRLDNSFSDTVMFARVLSQCITLWGSACSHYQPEPHLTVNLLLLQFTIRTGCFKKKPTAGTNTPATMRGPNRVNQPRINARRKNRKCAGRILVSIGTTCYLLIFPCTWTQIRMYTCSEGQDNLFCFANYFGSD